MEGQKIYLSYSFVDVTIFSDIQISGLAAPSTADRIIIADANTDPSPGNN